MNVAKRAVLDRIYALASRGAVLGLERVREACARLGHPERRFPSVHVAGTNGKGSVAAMLAAMARAEGWETGLYTSPHLCHFNERIRLNGEPIGDERLASSLGRVLDECPDLTFFEAATVAAFLAFAEPRVDLAILEVGLGGRLDATNVVEAPRATAITRIALDHMDRLGPDLASIAFEKAGILKPGVPVILGPLDSVSLRVVTDRATEVGAFLRPTTSDAELKAFIDKTPPALLGEHQRENAKVAVGLAREIGVSPAAIEEGLASVRWPGRLERLETPHGDVLLDAAHNPDGAASLATALRGMLPGPSRTSLVFGAMDDKDWRAMVAILAPLADHRVYMAPEGRRAADPRALAEIAPGSVATTIEEALAVARRSVGDAGTVVVAGSIFLVGAARAHLLGLTRDPVVAL